jgi:hypothetical protein
LSPAPSFTKSVRAPSSLGGGGHSLGHRSSAQKSIAE